MRVLVTGSGDYLSCLTPRLIADGQAISAAGRRRDALPFTLVRDICQVTNVVQLAQTGFRRIESSPKPPDPEMSG